MSGDAIASAGPQPRRAKTPERLEWERAKAEVARTTAGRIRIWLDHAVAACLRDGHLRRDHTRGEYQALVRDLLRRRPCMYDEAEFAAALRLWDAA